MTPLTDSDREAVKTIQEKTGNTVESSRALYRREATKLANPDVENRHELILESLERAGWDTHKVEAAPKKSRNERRLESKAKKAEKKAEKKSSKKSAKAKGEKKERVRKPKEEADPLGELNREADVFPIEDSKFHQVKFKGAWATAYVLERDRKAAARFAPVHIADTKLSELKKAAKKAEQGAVICVALRVNNKLEQGYIVPVDSLSYLGDENPYWRMEFTNSARKAHAESGYDGVKFTEKAVESEAA